MITDKIVYVTYRDRNAQEHILEMVLTGKQIEQTMLRRMETLMPTAQVVRVDDNKPDSLQLPIGAKK